MKKSGCLISAIQRPERYPETRAEFCQIRTRNFNRGFTPWKSSFISYKIDQDPPNLSDKIPKGIFDCPLSFIRPWSPLESSGRESGCHDNVSLFVRAAIFTKPVFLNLFRFDYNLNIQLSSLIIGISKSGSAIITSRRPAGQTTYLSSVIHALCRRKTSALRWPFYRAAAANRWCLQNEEAIWELIDNLGDSLLIYLCRADRGCKRGLTWEIIVPGKHVRGIIK